MRENKLIGIVVLAIVAAGLLWFFTRESSKHTDMMRDKQNFFPIENDSVVKSK